MFFLRKSKARQTTRFILVSDQSSCLGPVWLGYYGLSVEKVPDQSKREKERQERHFPGCPVVKNLPANAGDTGWIAGMGRFHVRKAAKPVCHSCWACAPQQEKVLVSCVQVCVSPWTEARQAPLSMEFSRQKYWSELPCLPPGGLSSPGIELGSPALAGGLFTTSATWETHNKRSHCNKKATHHNERVAPTWCN